MSPRWRRLAAGVTAVTVCVGGYAAWSASAEADTAYRTTTVSRGSVTSTLQLSGTLGSGDRADLAFGTAGTVAEVLATVGDKVTAGLVIARLDQTDLRSAVTRARADLAAARDQLQQDQDAQSETVIAATTSNSSSTSSGAGTSGGSGTTAGGSGQATGGSGSSGAQASSEASESAAEPLPTPDPEPSSSDPDPDPLDQAVSEALAELAAQQGAVTSAQSVASAALAEASSALEAQTAVCATAFTPTDPEPEGDPGDDETEDDPAGDATSADDPCTTALATVQTAQTRVAEAQDALQSALTTLADTLTAAVATLTDAASASGGAPEQGGQGESDDPEDQAGPNDDQGGEDALSAPPSQDAPADESQHSPEQVGETQDTATQDTGTQGTAMQGGETVTAATLARDQADIDTARADLAAAKMALAGSTLRAPHAGRLLALEADEGDSVGAGSDVGVLVAGGLSTVALSVTTDQVADLAIGQSADVTPVGATAPLPGEVTSVAAVPTTSTTGDSTYAVVVTLDERGLDLPEGAGAAAAVTTDEVSDALIVPASALTSGAVRVLVGDTLGRARVTTGLIGSGVVEVVDGVEEGDQVVLADLDAAVPTGDSETTTPGQGGFGGGGFRGGSGGVPGGVGPGAGGFGGGGGRG
ncbi:MAG: HlyD family efflux transporter periplasmic adaptor subunit [Nocardioides sp.]|uniref:HlyD family efflux transporter periplasmic adaptor subunit n=1 Tax=Nocardioides sp. TaxID=35761 RepID=UPI002399E66E|nr:HlyD family efflux transporter periplasmic adaptor subunit [Nocardioides sp.]MDE0774791.1 HlyD family efflux transporter periplasmic adaptor subunit [Nocardioides sp.]